MVSALLASPTFATFLLTSVLLAITPGPAVLYLLTRTLSHGRRAGLASIAGIAVGSLGNATLASFGLALVVAKSAAAFTVVKLVGAAYLMFLGVQALRAAPAPSVAAAPANSAPVASTSLSRLLRDGFLVALLNPKTALFFAALLPQFIDPNAAPLPQTLLLGGVFVAVAMCTDTAYVLAAAALAPMLRARTTRRPYGRYLSAVTFFALGVYAALASPRSTPRPLH